MLMRGTGEEGATQEDEVGQAVDGRAADGCDQGFLEPERSRAECVSCRPSLKRNYVTKNQNSLRQKVDRPSIMVTVSDFRKQGSLSPQEHVGANCEENCGIDDLDHKNWFQNNCIELNQLFLHS